MSYPIIDIHSASALRQEWRTGNDDRDRRILDESAEAEAARQEERERTDFVLRLENKCLLTLKEWPRVDWQTASQYLSSPKNRVTVELATPETSRSFKYQDGEKGEMFLPENFAQNLRPDVGVVLSAGPDAGLKPGDAVVVRAYEGTGRQGFQVADYIAEYEVVTFGHYLSEVPDSEILDVPLDESILGTLDWHECMINGTLFVNPYGRNIKVKRDAIVDQSQGILLTDKSRYRTNTGTVIQVGDKVTAVQPGNRVVYHPFAPLDVETLDGDTDLCLMHENAVEMILHDGGILTHYNPRMRPPVVVDVVPPED